MKLIVPQEGIGRIRRNVGAHGAVEIAMMLEACNIGRRRPVQVRGWVVINVEDLRVSEFGKLPLTILDLPSCTHQTKQSLRRDNGWPVQLRTVAGTYTRC